MAIKNSPKNTSKANPLISKIDQIADKMISITDSSYDEKGILNNKKDRFNDVINREMDLSVGVSGGSPIDFIASVRKTNQMSQQKNPIFNDSSALFSQDIDSVYAFFKDANKNKHLEMSDLKFISKFIPVLNDAVTTTLDSITTSDSISESISRTFNYSSQLTEDQQSTVKRKIESIEKSEKLLKKLKNIVYKNTLVTGRYFIYAKSYKSIFEEYSKKKAWMLAHPNESGSINPQMPANPKQSAKEASTVYSNSIRNILGKSYSDKNNNENCLDMTKVIESVTSFVSDTLKEETKNSNRTNQTVLKSDFNSASFKSQLEASLPKIYFDDNNPIMESAMEQTAVLDENTNNPAMSKFYEKIFGKNDNAIDVNGTLSTTDGIKSTTTKTEKFDVHGTYLKFIDYRNIIPIKVFDEVICYFYIHAVPKKGNGINMNSSLLSTSSALFSNTSLTEKKQQEAISNLVESISDGILDHFGKKFVADNAEYKKIIADCIIENGLTDNDYKIQIIPAEDIVDFKINETSDGDGESVLANSLFPAKLLLYYMIFTFLSYVNNSSDRSIAHIKKGPIDTATYNHLNRVIRMMQESKITFNDLLSSNMVFNKFARNNNMSMPTAQNGDRLIDMEVQEGQQFNYHTDFEDKLEKMAIMGTNTPTTILQYSDENANFEKEIVSANIKYAQYISSIQSDLEEPTTILYKKLLMNSDLDDEIKKYLTDAFQFKLPRPRVAADSNNSEFLTNITQMASTIADIMVGEKTNDNIETRRVVIENFCKHEAPFIDWDGFERIVDTSTIEAGHNQMKKDFTNSMKTQNQNTSNDSDSNDFSIDDSL
jgi:hypothetical protein